MTISGVHPLHTKLLIYLILLINAALILRSVWKSQRERNLNTELTSITRESLQLRASPENRQIVTHISQLSDNAVTSSNSASLRYDMISCNVKGVIA